MQKALIGTCILLGMVLYCSCDKRERSIAHERISLPVTGDVRCLERWQDSLIVAGGEKKQQGFVAVLDQNLELKHVLSQTLPKAVYDLCRFQGQWYIGLEDVHMIVTDSLGVFPQYWWPEADWVNTLHQQPFRRFAQTSEALFAACGGELAFGLVYQTYDTGRSWNPLEYEHELWALATVEASGQWEAWAGGNGIVLRCEAMNDWRPVPIDHVFVTDIIATELAHATILTYDGDVMATENAGEEWEKISTAPRGLYANRMVRDNQGNWFIAANHGRLGHSSDGGSTWRWYTLEDDLDLLDVLVWDDHVIFAGDQSTLIVIDLSEF